MQVPARVLALSCTHQLTAHVNATPRAARKNAFCFAWFVISTSANTFAVRLSRLSDADGIYSTSSVTFCIDVVKLMLCLFYNFFTGSEKPTSMFSAEAIIPASLFTWQTQLLLYSGRALPPTVFQTLGQLKIITAAFFTWFVLAKRFSSTQKVSLVTLTFGTVLVSYQKESFTSKEHFPFVAISAVVVAAISSGLAGVLVEKIMKESSESFAALNIKLASASAVLALTQFFCFDFVANQSFFSGFNIYTIAVIALSVASGLLAGLLLRNTDSVVKSFAVSCSLVLTSVVDVIHFGRKGTVPSYVGLIIVVCSILLYGRPST